MIVQAGLVAVAVGPANLPDVAALLGPILQIRASHAAAADATARQQGPLPILVCENQHGADGILRAAILERAAPIDSFACIATSIERMVRPTPDSLDLYAEAGQTLFVDLGQWEAGGRRSRSSGRFCFDGKHWMPATPARSTPTTPGMHCSPIWDSSATTGP